ncbi:MAG: hypothetical protein FJ030_05180 [Chloroflexi bacterium]|nr:hypothetical protein [Chloroflexota bacterium]
MTRLASAIHSGMVIVLAVSAVVGAAATRPLFEKWHKNWRASAPTSAPPAASVITHETFLLLGLDDFLNPQPQVEAVWLAIVPSDGSAVELVGLDPKPFAGQYSPALKSLPLMMLQPYLRGTLSGTAILDRAGLIELAERLGGGYLMGRTTNGAGLLDYIDSADPNRPDDLLVRQAAVVQSLLAQGAIVGVNFDLPALAQTPSHCSINEERIMELIMRYYPLKAEFVRVRLASNMTASNAAP